MEHHIRHGPAWFGGGALLLLPWVGPLRTAVVLPPPPIASDTSLDA